MGSSFKLGVGTERIGLWERQIERLRGWWTLEIWKAISQT